MANTYTKKNMFEAIKACAADGNLHIEDFNADLTDEMVVEFCDTELTALEKKAAKAKETAAKKKAEGDELADVVRSLLTNEPQTIADIAAQIEGDDVSVAKVQWRVVQLAKAGEAVKSEIVIPGVDGAKATKRAAYAKA